MKEPKMKSVRVKPHITGRGEEVWRVDVDVALALYESSRREAVTRAMESLEEAKTDLIRYSNWLNQIGE